MRRSVVLLALLLAACASKKAPAPGASPPAAVAATPPDAAPAPAPDAAPAAPAAPAAARKITKEEKQRYRAALRDGRAKLKKDDAKGAVLAFEAALAAVPDDARALSELGWAAFKAGDLVKARRATEKSIAAAGDAKLRAASLYNLGRVFEAENKKPQAIDAYRRSLALRPHATVRDRLVALDPDARPDQPIAPAALDGPFRTLADYCQELARREEDPDLRCTPYSRPGFPPYQLEKPYTEVAMVLTGYDEWCSLGIRTSAGWFVQEDFEMCREMGGRWDRVVRVDRLDLRDVVPGGAKELLLETASDEIYNDTPPDAPEDEMVVTSTHARMLMICGVGASGRPSCTPSFLVALSRDDEEGGWAFEPRYEDGALVLRLKEGGARADENAAALLGKHPLVFP